mgnify:CR=1 FL=1
MAAQVAVTTSVNNPREDFDINCLGTFNLLECCRLYSPKCSFIYASTNKVYGEFYIEANELDTRYDPIHFKGVNENNLLDFHSPYGCSKGCGDQYVIDYHRIYGLNTVCLRQSCIYGINQFGIEDQGWVSWFTIASTFDKKFYVYGDGKQVRDVLFISDLVDLYEKIIENIDVCSGEIYNVGGGPKNSLSLLELIEFLETSMNKKLNYSFDSWRPGDQKIYISNISKIYNHIGWEPKTSIKDGLKELLSWVIKNKQIFEVLDLI